MSLIITLLVLITNLSFAQYKEIPYETKVKLKSNNLILGFINPKNFSISHSINMSYMTMSGANVSLTSYTATLSYKVLDNLKISADVTAQYSPFASLGSNSVLNKEFQNSFNGINLSRVSLDYRPFKNMYININYINNSNNNFWYNDYNYYNRWNNDF